MLSQEVEHICMPSQPQAAQGKPALLYKKLWQYLVRPGFKSSALLEDVVFASSTGRHPHNDNPAD